MIKNKFKVLDDKVYNIFKFSNLRTLFFKLVTFFAGGEFFILLFIMLVLFLNNNRLLIIISVLLVINWLLMGSFKYILKRKRPTIKVLVKESGYSYPSGHTMNATCFYGFLIFLSLISDNIIYFKVGLIIVFLVLILLIGISRIYLGVHYFSDVIGGYLLSSSYLFLYVYFVHDLLKFI